MERIINRYASDSIVPAGKLAMDFLRFGERQFGAGTAQVQRFAACILSVNHPQANDGIYHIMAALICGLAAKDSVKEADGEAVEACRKICDVMGWQPRKVA